MIIKSIIIDDEKPGRENLSGLLQQYCPGVIVVAQAASVDEAIVLIRQLKPDLVFLDIEMPGKNGFQLLEHFNNFPFEVIFVTAHGNYAIRAIRFSASDYILKPININELIAAVDKVDIRIRQKEENHRLKQLFLNLQQPQNARIGLPTADRIEYAEVKTIIRCEGEGNYTHIWFVGKKHLFVAKTLVEFEDLLSSFNFVRIHKAHLVNLLHVVAYIKTDGGMLQLTNGEKIAISRRRKDFVLEKLK